MSAIKEVEMICKKLARFWDKACGQIKLALVCVWNAGREEAGADVTADRGQLFLCLELNLLLPSKAGHLRTNRTQATARIPTVKIYLDYIWTPIFIINVSQATTVGM